MHVSPKKKSIAVRRSRRVEKTNGGGRRRIIFYIGIRLQVKSNEACFIGNFEMYLENIILFAVRQKLYRLDRIFSQRLFSFNPRNRRAAANEYRPESPLRRDFRKSTETVGRPDGVDVLTVRVPVRGVQRWSRNLDGKSFALIVFVLDFENSPDVYGG